MNCYRNSRQKHPFTSISPIGELVFPLLSIFPVSRSLHLFADFLSSLLHRFFLQGRYRQQPFLFFAFLYVPKLIEPPSSSFRCFRRSSSRKPWIRSATAFKNARPHCSADPDSSVSQDCRNRKHWVALYEEYWKEQEEICDASS